MFIGEASPDDLAAIRTLYRDAFPGEDLLPLIEALSQEHAAVVSLVAVDGAAVTGHIALTRCAIADDPQALALLGPLAVAPASQARGIGTALIRAGIDHMRAGDVTRVLVLGDPNYYGRFGFTAEDRIVPPYPLPADWRTAWQSIRLSVGAEPRAGATLIVPVPWRQPALWGP
ncbi:MAG: N-acetyltransferase [Burkholderiaceae bacterium]